jgi:hypothetical protein
MAALVARSDTSAWQVMTQSFRPNLSPTEARLAFLETVSHLEYLRLRGKLQLDDRDGRLYYRA